MIGKNAKFNQKAKKVEKLKPISTRRDVSQSLTPVLKKLPPVATAVDKKIKKTFFNPSKEEYRRLVVGNFQDEFSKQSSKLFRVFLSSTFSDFKVERNELYRRVFPPIRERCAKIGFEFQVVDMRSTLIVRHELFFQHSFIDGVFRTQLTSIILLISFV